MAVAEDTATQGLQEMAQARDKGMVQAGQGWGKGTLWRKHKSSSTQHVPHQTPVPVQVRGQRTVDATTRLAKSREAPVRCVAAFTR